MTLFEYLAITLALIFALAAARLAGGLAYALAPARRSWVHVAFVVHELMRVAAGLWGFWPFQELEWTFPRFLLALAVPAIVYFLAATLVPEDPSHVLSWEDHYYEVCRRYFLGILGWTLAVAATTPAFVGLPLLHPFRLTQAAFAIYALTGAVSRSPRVHQVLAALAIAVPLVAALGVALGAGP